MYEERRNFLPFILLAAIVIFALGFIFYQNQKVVSPLPEGEESGQRVIFITPMPTPAEEEATPSATIEPTKEKEPTNTPKPTASNTASPTAKPTASNAASPTSTVAPTTAPTAVNTPTP